jgi:hypothetical protein
MAKGGRDKALDVPLGTIQKRFGEGAVMKPGYATPGSRTMLLSWLD